MEMITSTNTKLSDMSRGKRELNPIEISCTFSAMSSQVFRALTSQNELRKWWAPRVVMSRNTISQVKGEDIHVELISSEKNCFVRYAWRPETWDLRLPQTTITYNISDLGALRQNTGDGLLLDVVHDGWLDQKTRDHQEQIWHLALESLKSLLEEKKISPWWKKHNNVSSLCQVNLQNLKLVLEKYKKSKDSSSEKRHKVYQNIWQICNTLDAYGKWYLCEEDESFIFQYENQKLFKVVGEQVTLDWQDLEQLLGLYIEGFKDRLFVEQDIDFESNQSQISFPVASFRVELWIAWCIDLIKQTAASQRFTI